MKHFYNFVLRKSGDSLVLLMIIAGIFIAQIPNFQLDASSDSLVLEGDNNLRYYESIKKSYGSDDYLIVSYQVKDNLLDPAQLIHLKRLKTALQSIDQVSSVTTILDVPLFRSPPVPLVDLSKVSITIENGNADMMLASREFKSSPLYSNNLVSKDGKTTAILVSLKNNERFSQLRRQRDEMRLQRAHGQLTDDELTRLKVIEKQVIKNTSIKSELQAQIIANIRITLDQYRDKASLFLGGLPMITTDIVNYISNDLIVFSLAVVGLMTLILAIIFKGIRWVVMPIAISITAALVMTGILAYLEWKVTVISSNFFSLLLVMTLSVTIHLVVRYR